MVPPIMSKEGEKKDLATTFPREDIVRKNSVKMSGSPPGFTFTAVTDCRAIIARGNRLILEVTWNMQFANTMRALKWVVKNAASLGPDTIKGFLVISTEVGAHLASITATRARDRYSDMKLTGQCLIVPTLLTWPDDQVPADWQTRLRSHMENEDAPVLSEHTYEMFVPNLNVLDSEKHRGENFRYGSISKARRQHILPWTNATRFETRPSSTTNSWPKPGFVLGLFTSVGYRRCLCNSRAPNNHCCGRASRCGFRGSRK
ncbi:uncharacterized protein BDR25DRAFT_310106 [Lindgomyces ingoldianus]|uniref:Uncharacterized protein n=1 Tax=Lindgomyces ingoldianus TaxID=673940 RepID=A0ACB6RBX9_9PLEO|nr:uncharacterized protein BDR25DRAFT_310106 [Lindgomyces ingoldianus]KAF2476774.1 hypothetical protein BDR25DRAFT_310106 [Lindgomyces ingoldianus]